MFEVQPKIIAESAQHFLGGKCITYDDYVRAGNEDESILRPMRKSERPQLIKKLQTLYPIWTLGLMLNISSNHLPLSDTALPNGGTKSFLRVMAHIQSHCGATYFGIFGMRPSVIIMMMSNSSPNFSR